MAKRAKIIFVSFGVGLALFASFSIANYLSSARTVRVYLTSEASMTADRVVLEVSRQLEGRSSDLSRFVARPSIQSLLRDHASGMRKLDPSARAFGDIPADVSNGINELFGNGSAGCIAVTLFSGKDQPMVRVEAQPGVAMSGDGQPHTGTRITTRDFVAASIQIDDRVWSAKPAETFTSKIETAASVPFIRVAMPVNITESEAGVSRGALLAELSADALLKDATAVGTVAEGSNDAQSVASATTLLVMDSRRRLLVVPNPALLNQPIEAAFPNLSSVARLATTGEVDSANDRGESDSMMATRGVPDLGITVVVLKDGSALLAPFWLALWIELAFSILGAAIVALCVYGAMRYAGKSIRQVAEDALAIASGDLERRALLRSTDDMRPIADGLDSLREQIRLQLQKETESRQFESFMRLTAMLSHDLKNAIAGMSLLVRNIGLQFHRAEFRADAIESLTEETEKLRAIVARLSQPVRTLSGEFALPRPIDLIPILRDVVDRKSSFLSPDDELVMQLPEALIAIAEAERIEGVAENLVLNAIEAMAGKQGRLVVEAGEVNEGEVYFSVSDSGPGMSDEFIRDQLFRPFQTTKAAGIGLGLYTCREVLAGLGGSIAVESVEGAGTTFRVVLPARVFQPVRASGQTRVQATTRGAGK